MANHEIIASFIGIAYLITLVPVSNALNLGLISGDLKRSSNPLIIKKTSHHSPITINIRPGITHPRTLVPSILPPTSPFKPLIKTKIKRPLKTSIRSPKLLKLPIIPKLPKLPKIPKVPKLPILPLIPPILPPILPKLPLLPLPLLPILPPPLPPIIPGLSALKKPIRVPILGKTKLQKALASELRPLKVPSPKSKRNKKILEKLLQLKRNGSLNTSQFMRFKKLLL